MLPDKLSLGKFPPGKYTPGELPLPPPHENYLPENCTLPRNIASWKLIPIKFFVNLFLSLNFIFMEIFVCKWDLFSFNLFFWL